MAASLLHGVRPLRRATARDFVSAHREGLVAVEHAKKFRALPARRDGDPIASVRWLRGGHTYIGAFGALRMRRASFDHDFGAEKRCRVCWGIEATLPSECPAQPMTPEQLESVADGILDFINGEWAED